MYLSKWCFRESKLNVMVVVKESIERHNCTDAA